MQRRLVIQYALSSQMPMRVNGVLKAAAFSRDDIVDMHHRAGEGRLVDRLTNRQRAQSFPNVDLGFLSIPAHNLAASAISRQALIVMPSGFSQRTCRPAS